MKSELFHCFITPVVPYFIFYRISAQRTKYYLLVNKKQKIMRFFIIKNMNIYHNALVNINPVPRADNIRPYTCHATAGIFIRLNPKFLFIHVLRVYILLNVKFYILLCSNVFFYCISAQLTKYYLLVNKKQKNIHFDKLHVT